MEIPKAKTTRLDHPTPWPWTLLPLHCKTQRHLFIGEEIATLVGLVWECQGCASRICRSRGNLHLLLEVFLIKAAEISAINIVRMKWPSHTPRVFLRKRIMRDAYWLQLYHILPTSPSPPTGDLPCSRRQHLRCWGAFTGCSLSLHLWGFSTAKIEEPERV